MAEVVEEVADAEAEVVEGVAARRYLADFFGPGILNSSGLNLPDRGDPHFADQLTVTADLSVAPPAALIVTGRK